MKIYLQVRPDNVITDCITYPYANYVEHEVDFIPQGINGGWFKFEGGEIVEYPELKPISRDEEIEKLKERQSTTEDALLGLLLGGM